MICRKIWSKTETIINDRTKALIQEKDEAVAACAVMRETLELINYNTPPLFDVISKVRRALSTNYGKAFIDRMKKLEAKVERYEIVLKDVASDDLDRVSGGIKNAAQYALTPPNSDTVHEQILEDEKALSTDCGKALFDRMKEAEWLIDNVHGMRDDKTREWFERQQAWLKGGGK